MPALGHTPVANFGHQTEAAVFPVPSGEARQTDVITLAYYKAPHRRRAIGENIMEAGILDGTEKNAEAEPMGALPDAALASFGDVSVMEAVIGNDDRVKVANSLMGQNPWRQICSLRIKAANDALFVGTAWYIGPRLLVTAGHCVFLQDAGGWPKWIDIIPARWGVQKPFGTLRATRFATVRGWKDQREREYDYGVIFLDDSTVGDQVGNFAVSVLSDNQLSGINAKISGYPSDRDLAQFQYYHERPIQSVTPSRLTYDIDTFGGQSGSCIFQHTEENGIVAVGIHTTGGLTSNSGTRINDDVMTNLLAWLEK